MKLTPYLVLLLSALALVGCGPQDPDVPRPPENVPVSPPTTAAPPPAAPVAPATATPATASPSSATPASSGCAPGTTMVGGVCV